MLVSELIAQLSEHDPDATVVLDRTGITGRRAGAAVSVAVARTPSGDTEVVVVSQSPREMLRGPARPLPPEQQAERKAAAAAKKADKAKGGKP